MMLTSIRADWYGVYDAGSNLMDSMMHSLLWSEWCAWQNDDEQLMRQYVNADWRGARDKCWCDVTVCFNCKCKLVLLLRLGYLKPFLAGSKKTRQGPGCRVGALCISRCWFYLTVVAGPKLIQKDYKIIWCCVLLCYGSWWFKCLWYVNDEVK